LIAPTVRSVACTASPIRSTRSKRPAPRFGPGVGHRENRRTGTWKRSGRLLIAQRSGRQARVRCLNQIRHLAFTSPDSLREQFRDVPKAHLAARAAALRPREDGDPVLHAAKLAMRTLGRRAVAISDDMHTVDVVLAELVAKTAPALLACNGVGVDTAAILLSRPATTPNGSATKPRGRTYVVSRPRRAVREATPASAESRRNRQANHALWRIVFTRMGSDDRTRVYVERRTEEGLTKREIMRVLKRYVARETYQLLQRS
jgi:transposase